MEDNRHTFTGRMLDRASSRRNLNGVVIDSTTQHLRRKHTILCAIDNELDRPRDTYRPHNITTIERNKTEVNNTSTISSSGIQELKMLNAKPKSDRLYPILADIKFHTTRKNINNENVTNVNNDRVEIYKTPKATRRFHKPNLESTRKSPKKESVSKMNSPQTETTISTIPLIDSPRICEEKSPNSIQAITDVPDEVEKFLQNALGDEMYNNTVTYIDANQATNSHINTSELLSESRTPFHRKIKKLLTRRGTSSKDDDPIISLPRTSETLDRTTRLYRSLSQRVKNKLRAALSKQKATIEIINPIAISHGPIDDIRAEKIESLLRHVRLQQSIMRQATKALEVCYMNKQFIGSPEEVESERLLLLAYLRKRILMEELKNLSSPDQQHAVINSNRSSDEYAEVQIDNIKLTLRRALHQTPEPGDIHEWFLVVVFEGTNLWATPAVPCPIDDITIDFPNFSCLITKLTPNLKITVEVYVLKLITGVTYHHEEKYHITNERVQSHACPSPQKLLKKVERPSPSRARYPVRLTSSFALSGYVELFLGDLILVSPWPLSAVPRDSILLGTIDLKLNSTLHLSIMHEGFLNYGDESGGLAIWNRRWCVLKGYTLMFWNYPREQENKQLPLVMIDLIHCISEKIAPVNRSLCAKPRTLLIETIRARNSTDRDSLMVECRQGSTIIRHLLSCDSTRELVDWMSKLNHIVSLLRQWNINTSHYNTTSRPTAPLMVSEL